MRATTPLEAGQVDDTPYGGGAGMVIRVDVVEAALEGALRRGPAELRARRRVIALAAGGRQFDDALAAELAAEPALTLLCGRYEGFDERVHEHLATDVVSIGPYVLAGGELAAMVVCDAVIRKLPGRARARGERAGGVVLAGARRRARSIRTTRARRAGAATTVPEVLLSGDHARIARWRLERSRERAAGPTPPGFADHCRPSRDALATIAPLARSGPLASATTHSS